MRKAGSVWNPKSRFQNNRSGLWQILKPWLEAFSYVAQIAAVVLAWYGYVHTVLPVFQKEKLDEDLARLELEQEKATTELSRVRGLQHLADSRLDAINKEAEVAKSRAKEAIQSRDREVARSELLRRKNEVYEGVVRDAKGSILDLEWTQFIERTGLNLAFSLNRDFIYYEAMPWLSDGPTEPPEWPDGLKYALKAVDDAGAEVSRENRETVVSHAKAYIRRNSVLLVCPSPPDFKPHVIVEHDKPLSDAAFACEKKLGGFTGRLMDLKLGEAPL